MLFLLGRLIGLVLVVLGITLVTFITLHVFPSDPVMLLAGPGATPDQVQQIRADLGLDQPLPFQYLTWLGRTLSGDFGRSFIYKRPVIEMIGAALPNTLQLSVLALLVALLVGVPLGVLAARHRGTTPASTSNTRLRMNGVSAAYDLTLSLSGCTSIQASHELYEFAYF